MFTFYLFVVSGFSLLAFYFGAVVGVGELADSLIGHDSWSSWMYAAHTLSYALAAFALWGFHWRQLQKLIPSLKGDWLGFHHFYLVGIVGLMALGIYVHGGGSLSDFVDILERPASSQEWSSFTGAITSFVLSFGLWIFHLKDLMMSYPTKPRRVSKLPVTA